MDSGNSGSMQSSSGGDEEYDSSFLNPPPPTTLNDMGNISISNSSTFLYPNDSYNNTILQPFSHSPTTSSSLYNSNNLQDFWSKSQLTQQNYQPFQSSPSQQPSNQSNQDRSFQSSLQPSDHHHHHNQSSNIVKNPKKRTRASRRAPTTVLTTDTSNFRQMVQEFTGIPASPFSGASPYSRRLDLFGTASGGGGSLLYPLRPSAQKAVNVQPSSLYNNMVGNSQPHQNVMNMQGNSILNLQSMLQSQPSNISQESSRNIPVLEDDDAQHFGSFNAPNNAVDKGAV